MIALGIALMPVFTRIACAQTLSVKENEYITAGRVLGFSNLRIMMSHVLPNIFPPLLVQATLLMGAAIIVEAALSFLGIGVEAPLAAWGSMVADGRTYLLDYPILSIAPGFSIMLAVFGINMVGDGLRDALDPRLRGTI